MNVYFSGLQELDVNILKYLPDSELKNIYLNHSLLVLLESDYFWREKIHLIGGIEAKPDHLSWQSFYFFIRDNPPDQDIISQALHLTPQQAQERKLTELGILSPNSHLYQSPTYLLPIAIESGNSALTQKYLAQLNAKNITGKDSRAIIIAAIRCRHLRIVTHILKIVLASHNLFLTYSTAKIVRELGLIGAMRYYKRRITPIAGKISIHYIDTIGPRYYDYNFLEGLILGHHNKQAYKMLTRITRINKRRFTVMSCNYGFKKTLAYLCDAAFKSKNYPFIRYIEKHIPRNNSEYIYNKSRYCRIIDEDVISAREAFTISYQRGEYQRAYTYLTSTEVPVYGAIDSAALFRSYIHANPITDKLALESLFDIKNIPSSELAAILDIIQPKIKPKSLFTLLCSLLCDCCTKNRHYLAPILVERLKRIGCVYYFTKNNIPTESICSSCYDAGIYILASLDGNATGLFNGELYKPLINGLHESRLDYYEVAALIRASL